MDFQQHKIQLINQLRKLRMNAEKAMIQVPDELFFARLSPEANSVAILMKHLAGNMAWRWKELLTSDDEKPVRKRELEFVILPTDTRRRLDNKWDTAWSTMIKALQTLGDEDFAKTIVVRGTFYTIFEITVMQIIHISEHVGQIIFLAKHFAGDRWQTLTVPKAEATQL